MSAFAYYKAYDIMIFIECLDKDWSYNQVLIAIKGIYGN